jgi:hypothetical protein
MTFSLRQLTSGMFSRVLLNSNFEKIENKVNDDLVHRQNGSAQMQQDLDMNSNQILNVADPVIDLDVATKRYVDNSHVDVQAQIAANLSAIQNIEASGTIRQTSEEFTATNGQTVFTLTTTTFAGEDTLAVYVNGVRQSHSAYTTSNTNVITFSEALQDGDKVLFTVNESTSTVLTTEQVSGLQVGTIADLPSNVATDKLSIVVSDENHGGTFIWEANVAKTEHNGGTIIDPDVDMSTWTYTSANTNNGVWRRQYDGAVNVKWFGLSHPVEDKWIFDTNDLSTKVSDDTDKVFYFNLTGTDGSNGCLVRIYENNKAYISESLPQIAKNYNLQFFVNECAERGLEANLDVDEIIINDTVMLSSLHNNLRIVGSLKNKTTIVRQGTADTWRACFYIDSASVYLDGLYLKAEQSFNERCGVAYGSLATGIHKIGEIEGEGWRLGVVYPKDTPNNFYLQIDSIKANYAGRAYSSSTPSTPSGNIKIKHIYQNEAGFVDISGGSVEIDSLVSYRNDTSIMKKGSEAEGGVIVVDNITATESKATLSIVYSGNSEHSNLVLDETVVGQTSGATAKINSRSYNQINVYDVVGSFNGTEQLVTQTSNITLTATSVSSLLGRDENALFYNAGKAFEKLLINNIYMENCNKDLIWVSNNGDAVINNVKVTNCNSERHFIRHAPLSQPAGAPVFVTSRKLSINNIYIDNLINPQGSSYYFIFTENDANLEITNGLVVVEKGAAGAAYLIQMSGNYCFNNLKISSSDYFSRGIRSLGTSSRFNRITNCIFDYPTNRWLTNNSPDSIFSHVRYKGASQDGTEASVDTDVSAFS